MVVRSEPAGIRPAYSSAPTADDGDRPQSDGAIRSAGHCRISGRTNARSHRKPALRPRRHTGALDNAMIGQRVERMADAAGRVATETAQLNARDPDPKRDRPDTSAPNRDRSPRRINDASDRRASEREQLHNSTFTAPTDSSGRAPQSQPRASDPPEPAQTCRRVYPVRDPNTITNTNMTYAPHRRPIVARERECGKGPREQSPRTLSSVLFVMAGKLGRVRPHARGLAAAGSRPY